MNNVYISVENGLGDKFLDLIGFYVICKCLNYKPNVEINRKFTTFDWGNNNYDLRLFDFNDITITNNNTCEFYIRSPNASSSLCPYKVYEFIQKFLPEITFEEISNYFNIYAKDIIKPSKIITSKIPNNIEKAYGIHLRKSDKIRPEYDCDVRHENLQIEFDIITDILLNNIKDIIINEEEPVFLVVSEDDIWKDHFKNIIKNISSNYNKNIEILEIDYTNENNYNNYNSILDMFCLSKCKTIIQGVKYSSFSILSSILGKGKLINYSTHLSSGIYCLTHSWNSVIEINNKINFDKEFHKKITKNVLNIETNIL
jgi:hypothetical protein